MIYSWEKGRGFHQQNFWKACRLMGLSLQKASDIFAADRANAEPGDRIIDQEALKEAGYEVPPETEQQNVAPSPAPRKRATEKEFPIYGFVGGSARGRLTIVKSASFGNIRCPVELEGASQPYGVIVDGDSMKGRYRHGVRLHVNPDKTYRKGHDVIVQFEDVDGSVYGLVREFVSRNKEQVTVRQLNPDRELTYDEVVAIHRVVGHYEAD